MPTYLYIQECTGPQTPDSFGVCSYLWLLSHTCLLQISPLKLHWMFLETHIVLWIDFFFQIHFFMRMLQTFCFHHQLACFNIVPVAFYRLFKGCFIVVRRLGYVGQVKLEVITWLILSIGRIQDRSGTLLHCHLSSINKYLLPACCVPF